MTDNKKAQAEETQSIADRLAAVKAQKAELTKQASNTVAGGETLQPKQALLDASDVEALHPDKRVRWVNLRNPDKVLVRQMEGYSRLPESEGGRSLGGEMALFAIPKEKYEARVKRQDQLGRDRMVIHLKEAEALADSIAKVLRDKHGINVDPRELMSDKINA